MEILTSTNHNKADQSKFDTVISLVERSAEGQNFHSTGLQRKNFEWSQLISPMVYFAKKKKEGLKLLTLIGYNLDEFIEELKLDPTMINPTLPEWDSECSDIAGELFDILDTNDDKVLNQKDLNPLLTKRNSKLIANKVKDLDETAFDMKIRVAGPIDFTLPSEDVESMIMALTRRDLGIWQQKQDNDENVNQKDEL